MYVYVCIALETYCVSGHTEYREKCIEELILFLTYGIKRACIRNFECNFQRDFLLLMDVKNVCILVNYSLQGLSIITKPLVHVLQKKKII